MASDLIKACSECVTHTNEIFCFMFYPRNRLNFSVDTQACIKDEMWMCEKWINTKEACETHFSPQPSEILESTEDVDLLFLLWIVVAMFIICTIASAIYYLRRFMGRQRTFPVDSPVISVDSPGESANSINSSDWMYDRMGFAGRVRDFTDGSTKNNSIV